MKPRVLDCNLVWDFQNDTMHPRMLCMHAQTPRASSNNHHRVMLKYTVHARLLGKMAHKASKINQKYLKSARKKGVSLHKERVGQHSHIADRAEIVGAVEL